MPAARSNGLVEAHEILDYWFSPVLAKHWFSSTPALDQEIKARFETVWLRAVSGELDAWSNTPDGALALIIVLDQFPLNMYRGEAAAFASEQQAAAITRRAVDQGFHDAMPDARRLFLFLPLMHSELMEDQDRSLELFRAAGMDTHWPEHHRNIIRRFGRFPHRNAILGRESTPEELDYLASDAAFKG
jgi:uncharacterized protein (DUF924 family)